LALVCPWEEAFLSEGALMLEAEFPSELEEGS